MEHDFLAQPGMADVVRNIIREREALVRVLAPSTNLLGIRAPCPIENCGLVEKYGRANIYDLQGDQVHFSCPHYGRHSLHIESDITRFQFNNVFWTLLIARYYENYPTGYLQICGSDYTGFWQEQIIWRHIQRPLLIVYTPLIVDWSGSKLSKSLYLSRDAYAYLRAAGQEYLCSYAVLKSQGKSLEPLCREVNLWIKEPYRLFRAYSVHYFHMLYGRQAENITGLLIFQQPEESSLTEKKETE